MNPATYRSFLEPVIGEEATANLVEIATRHKLSAARSVQVPSYVVVALADEIVRLSQAIAREAFKHD